MDKPLCDYEGQIRRCLGHHQPSLQRRLKKLHKLSDAGRSQSLPALIADIEQSVQMREQKIADKPGMNYPGSLPITGKISAIKSAIRDNTVTVICGETGSGKSTQIPKICLDLGYGLDRWIGHTQPRRIAATSIAARLSDEMGTDIGRQVGFKIRHTDRTSEQSWVKLMTDGVLLAEMQQDRWLNHYDVLIVDEAHERSLNIDFILGTLKLLIARRPEMKVIVTSATIDVKRFADYFNDAPVIQISGRSYPVQVRYQPIAEQDDDSEARETALLAAIQSLDREGRGDILVFLDGEKEIRDMHLFLRKQSLPATEVLPLYARLSGHLQARVFQPHRQRHIVLATNVAETSLTIDGIKYVIDFGYARISRYSYRSKVQRLPIEKISRASANQRAGRCGRVSDGICIRLYDEDDFQQRPEFTEPEIVRTKLAAVILQMKALKIGDIREFDFIQPPNSRAINDGIRLLHELNAIDENESLTRVGRLMARLPVEPRLARMLLAARDWHCLGEVLIIVSALGIQEPKERPAEEQEKADTAHARFDAVDSDFLWYLNFWNFYQEQKTSLSKSQLRKLCKQNFVSPTRMAEWQSIHTQLTQICRQLGFSLNHEPAKPDNIHCALLSGLSSHIALKDQSFDYIGARQTRLKIFPGSTLFRSAPKWFVAYELVETSQLYARTVARINPEWCLKTAPHLVQYDYIEPQWDEKQQRITVTEKASLYGLMLYANKKRPYAKVNAVDCRKLFIEQALVTHALASEAAWLEHNRQLVDELHLLEKKQRRPGIIDEENLFAFYDAKLPNDVNDLQSLDRWRRQAEKTTKEILFLRREQLLDDSLHEQINTFFPDELQLNTINLPLQYQFSPGEKHDGISIDVPIQVLNQISEQQLDRLVPGLIRDKTESLLKSLPKSIRKQLVPLPDTLDECMHSLPAMQGKLTDCLSGFLHRRYGISREILAFNEEELPEHLQLKIRVLDEQGNCLEQGNDLYHLQQKLSGRASEEFHAANEEAITRSGLTDWTFGSLPGEIEIEINGQCVPAYPVLRDDENTVSIILHDMADAAERINASGLRRLCMLRLAKSIKYLEKNIAFGTEIKLLYSTIGEVELFIDEMIKKIFHVVFINGQQRPCTREEFDTLIATGEKKLVEVANDLAETICDILQLRNDVLHTLAAMYENISDDIHEDITHQVNSLIYDGFLAETPVKWLRHYPRFLHAIQKRMNRAGFGNSQERQKMQILHEYEQYYYDLYNNCAGENQVYDEIDTYRWMLQEYRVSLFAQPMKTSMPISLKRLDRQLELIKKA